MRVVCPGCNATYEVPAPLLGGAARRLRCARCKQEWSVEAQVLAPGAPKAPPPPDRTVAEQPGPMARLLDGGAVADQPVRSAPAAAAERARPADDDDPFALEPAIRARLDQKPPGPDAAAARPLATSGSGPAPLAAQRDGSLTADKRPSTVSASSDRGGKGAALAWVLSVAILCACIAAAFVWRAEIMRVWPPSERVYLALGLR